MKIVTVSRTYPAPISKGWEMICDIKNYPKFVPFIRETTVTGPLKKGMIWYDTTNLLWVTQRIVHIVEVVEKNKRLVFRIPVTGGEVREDLLLEQVGKQTKITMTVSVVISPWIVEETIGRILAARFRIMLEKTLENIDSYFRSI